MVRLWPDSVVEFGGEISRRPLHLDILWNWLALRARR